MFSNSQYTTRLTEDMVYHAYNRDTVTQKIDYFSEDDNQNPIDNDKEANEHENSDGNGFGNGTGIGPDTMALEN